MRNSVKAKNRGLPIARRIETSALAIARRCSNKRASKMIAADVPSGRQAMRLMTSIQALRRDFSSVTLAGSSALVSAFWVAVCAAAPEFLWQGLRIALSHFSRLDLISALLIGVILAFFVEPLMRRIDNMFNPARGAPERRSALFTAILSLSFALASVGVHHALTAFVSERGIAVNSRVAAALSLTAEWGIVPWAIALAWLSVQWGWLKVPLGITAACSAGIAGWLFSWSAEEIIITAIPCLLILGFGYRRITKQPKQFTFASCAPSVTLVAAGWLTITLLVDTSLGFYELAEFKLYAAADFWVDARFYFGWTLGLLLVPPPPRAREPGQRHDGLVSTRPATGRDLPQVAPK